MSLSVQDQITQQLIKYRIPSIFLGCDWPGIEKVPYSSNVALTDNIVFLPNLTLDSRPCSFEEASALANELKSVGVNFESCDELSYFYSYFITALPSHSIEKVKELSTLLNFLGGRVISDKNIKFSEPKLEESESQESPSARSVSKSEETPAYETRFKVTGKFYSPAGQTPASVTISAPGPRIKPLKRKPQTAAKKRATLARAAKKEERRGLNLPVDSSSGSESDFDVNPTRLFQAPISPVVAPDQGFSFTTIEPRPDSVDEVKDYAVKYVEASEFTSFGLGSRISVESVIGDFVMAARGDKSTPKRTHDEAETSQDAMMNVSGGPVLPESGTSKRAKSDSVSEVSDHEEVVQARFDRGGRDLLVTAERAARLRKDPPAAFCELAGFVTNKDWHSDLVKMSTFDKLPAGLNNVTDTDGVTSVLNWTDDDMIIDIEYASIRREVVKVPTVGLALAPPPRSDTEFFYRHGENIFMIDAEDYAMYWSICYTLSGEEQPTRNMIILCAVALDLEFGGKVLNELTSQFIVDHIASRMVTSRLITCPYGIGDVVINEEYLKKISFRWNLDDDNIHAMREGCKFSGFDLEATIMRAVKNYEDAEGHMSRSLCREFMLDLKIVALVTYMRGFSLDKIFQKWEDKSLLQKFKTLCQRLGIKSTRQEAPAKDELTLSRVPLLVPYAQPKYCLRDEKPGVTQSRKLPKAAHCGSFCGIVPVGEEWDGVFNAGICYLVFQDLIINKKAKKQQRVSQLIAFSTVARLSATTLTKRNKIHMMRSLGITNEIQSRFNSLVALFSQISDETTKTANPSIEATLSQFPDIWGEN